MILTDEEVITLAAQGTASPDDVRAIEAAVLAKLSKDWVMPAPVHTGTFGYTANQLREAFSAGAAAQISAEPVAWRTFDGEGGYDYRSYEDNEDYADQWARRNPNYIGWVEPLFTKVTL